MPDYETCPLVTNGGPRDKPGNLNMLHRGAQKEGLNREGNMHWLQTFCLNPSLSSSDSAIIRALDYSSSDYRIFFMSESDEYAQEVQAPNSDLLQEIASISSGCRRESIRLAGRYDPSQTRPIFSSLSFRFR
ncbi:unnamed protein product [Pleuronectes platessa]|uniref:Uncharacterized protein n=1 Tax=Pleuronectes platessa TaxID=8262 RepID=A0A9N7ULQ4_PLEPL|nr:unnamed protein product [Pleuronectes platessa]